MTGFIELVTLVAAVSAATVACSHKPAAVFRAAPSRHQRMASASVVPERLTVRVLGSAEVRHTQREVGLTPRQLELVVYLATHPGGVSEDHLRCALWPDQPVTSAALRNLLCKTRQRLGHLHGEPALPVMGADRRYRLHRHVHCDLHSLDSMSDTTAARRALEMVRGRPFDVDRGFDWAYREGLVGWAEQRIAAAAHQVSASRLAAGDPVGALTAAERGLRGVPGDEQLYRDRMLAHAAAGNPAGVERVMTELLAVLEASDPHEVLHPDTVDLYRRHGRGAAFSEHRAAPS